MENLLYDVAGQNKVGKLSILVSGGGEEQLIGVLKMLNAARKAMTDAVTIAITSWNIAGNIIGMSFDTIASNTGVRNGACVLLENNLQRPLSHLVCRHHILEFILQTVFSTAMDVTTSGPDNLLFK